MSTVLSFILTATIVLGVIGINEFIHWCFRSKKRDKEHE